MTRTIQQQFISVSRQNAYEQDTMSRKAMSLTACKDHVVLQSENKNDIYIGDINHSEKRWERSAHRYTRFSIILCQG